MLRFEVHKTPKPHDRTSTDAGRAAPVTLELHKTPKPHDRTSTDAGSAVAVIVSTLQQSGKHDGTSLDIACTLMNVNHQWAATALPISSVKVGKKTALTAAEERAKKTEEQRLKR